MQLDALEHAWEQEWLQRTTRRGKGSVLHDRVPARAAPTRQPIVFGSDRVECDVVASEREDLVVLEDDIAVQRRWPRLRLLGLADGEDADASCGAGAPLAAITSVLSSAPTALRATSRRATLKTSSFWKTTSSFSVTVSSPHRRRTTPQPIGRHAAVLDQQHIADIRPPTLVAKRAARTPLPSSPTVTAPRCNRPSTAGLGFGCSGWRTARMRTRAAERGAPLARSPACCRRPRQR